MDIFKACTSNEWQSLLEILESDNTLINSKNKFSETPLHIAAKSGSIECVKILIEKGATINSKDIMGCSPLHVALEKPGNSICIKILLDNGINIHTVELYGLSPIHIAVGHPEYIDILVKHGADINAKNIYDDTPLHRAATFTFYKSIYTLLDYGADWTLTNYKNETFLEYMSKEYRETFEKYISDRGELEDKYPE